MVDLKVGTRNAHLVNSFGLIWAIIQNELSFEDTETTNDGNHSSIFTISSSFWASEIKDTVWPQPSTKIWTQVFHSFFI